MLALNASWWSKRCAINQRQKLLFGFGSSISILLKHAEDTDYTNGVIEKYHWWKGTLLKRRWVEALWLSNTKQTGINYSSTGWMCQQFSLFTTRTWNQYKNGSNQIITEKGWKQLEITPKQSIITLFKSQKY